MRPVELSKQQAESQLLACLVFVGDRAALESRSPSGSNASESLESQYHLALLLARQGEVDDSLVLLRKILTRDSRHAQARGLAYRLIGYLAEKAAAEGHWQKLPDLLTEAIDVEPNDCDAAKDFAKFSGTLPISHLRSGQRDQAARLWEQQLRENPEDSFALHNLALLHYWWARGARKNGDESKVYERWQPAIAYWSLLQWEDAFWIRWSSTRAQAWGFALSAQDIETLRKQLPEKHLDHHFQDMLDDARQRGRTQLAEQYDQCLKATLLERRSAQCWKKAIGVRPAGMLVGAWLEKSSEPGVRKNNAKPNAASGLLDLSGGVAFFHFMGLEQQIQRMASALSTQKQKGGESLCAEFRMLFSPDGLGEVLIQIEERNAPSDALAQLERSRPEVKKLPEFVYLQSLALWRVAEQLLTRGEFSRALDQLNRALQQFKSQAADAVFRDLAAAARTAIGSEISATALKEAKRLKLANQPDEAIQLLDQMKDTDTSVADQLCTQLCDRGGSRISNKDLVGARADFSKVVKLRPDYERARDGLSTTYNNEGCLERDADKAIALFEKAQEWNPTDYMVKQNLARELRGKAVDRVNASNSNTQRQAVADAVKLLERAFGLVCSELKPDALNIVRNQSERDPEDMKKQAEAFNDEVLKAVTANLVDIYVMRKRIGR